MVFLAELQLQTMALVRLRVEPHRAVIKFVTLRNHHIRLMEF